MLLEVTSPVRGWSTKTILRTELEGSFEIPEFHTKQRERRDKASFPEYVLQQSKARSEPRESN